MDYKIEMHDVEGLVHHTLNNWRKNRLKQVGNIITGMESSNIKLIWWGAKVKNSRYDDKS